MKATSHEDPQDTDEFPRTPDNPGSCMLQSFRNGSRSGPVQGAGGLTPCRGAAPSSHIGQYGRRSGAVRIGHARTNRLAIRHGRCRRTSPGIRDVRRRIPRVRDTRSGTHRGRQRPSHHGQRAGRKGRHRLRERRRDHDAIRLDQRRTLPTHQGHRDGQRRGPLCPRSGELPVDDSQDQSHRGGRQGHRRRRRPE